MFEQFPYTNLHELNLDWILQKLKEAYSPDNPPDNMVLSVNGETGDVILYQDAVIRFPDIEDATWNIHRIANHSSSGIQFLPEKAQRIDGTVRHDIYDEGNPPPYPVTSVNGQTGAVSIVIPVTSVNGETGAVILYRNAVTRLPDVTEGTWNIYRLCNGTQRGIQFSADKAERVEGLERYAVYDAGNPPPYPVTSVNGETGAVTIPDVVTDLDAEILNIDTATEENYWGFVRGVSNGTASIYLDTSNNTIKAYISYISDDDQTNVTLPLLTSADIPSSAGVISINSKTGAVTLYGTDIYTDSNSQRTVSQELSANANAITAETTRAGNAESTLTTNLNAEISRAGAEEAKLQDAVAIIVDGDEAGQAVPVGGYAYIKNNTHGLDDGLYINSGSAVFPATGGTADGTTFTAISGGGLNSLNSKITKKTIPLTAGSGVTLSNENCYEMNGVVCLSFKATGAMQSGAAIATIPSNYAPSITIPAFGISNADDSFRSVYISSSGNISAYGASTNDIRITIVYML